MTKRKQVISLRPEQSFGEKFWTAVEVLGVRDSELARRALGYGFERAAKELAAEKKKQARETLAKLEGKLSFNSPHNAWSHMVSA